VTYRPGEGLIDKVCTVEVKRPVTAHKDMQIVMRVGEQFAEPVVLLSETLPMKSEGFVRDVYGVALAMKDESLTKEQPCFVRLQLEARQEQVDNEGGPATIDINVMVSYPEAQRATTAGADPR
jgi:hypothetical protein